MPPIRRVSLARRAPEDTWSSLPPAATERSTRWRRGWPAHIPRSAYCPLAARTTWRESTVCRDQFRPRHGGSWRARLVRSISSRLAAACSAASADWRSCRARRSPSRASSSGHRPRGGSPTCSAVTSIDSRRRRRCSAVGGSTTWCASPIAIRRLGSAAAPKPPPQRRSSPIIAR